MAVVKWIGGASATAQVDDLTPGGTIEASDEFTVTLTAEDGSTSQSVTAIAGGTTVADVTAAVQAACAASTQSLFQRITFTEDGSTITLTAKVPGVPFYCTVSTTESGGGAADAQTFSRASTTANSGPNDWNTAANWSGASVPVSTDDVIIADTSYSILFGLDQSSVALASLRIGESFRGDVGDAAGGYELLIDATDVFIAATSGVVRLDGDMTNVYLQRTTRSEDAVVFGTNVGTVYADGPAVKGGIRFKANTTVGSVYLLGVDPGTRITTSGTTDVTTLEMSSGIVEHDGDRISTAIVTGGTLVMLGSSNSLATTVYPTGTVDYQASGTLTTANVRGGTLTFARNRSTGVTVTTLNVLGGLADLRNGLDNVTVTNNPTVRGGMIRTDTGTTLDPKV